MGPAGIGGFAGAWVVAAAGGALVTAIGATIVWGVVGAGLGRLLLFVQWHATMQQPSNPKSKPEDWSCGSAHPMTRRTKGPWTH